MGINSEIHERLFSILEKERETKCDLFFKPRRTNNSNRLTNGYWFIGNDSYLQIGFAEGFDSKEKIHNIGFVVNKSGESWIEFSAQDDKLKADFLRKLAKYMGFKSKDKNKSKWYKVYNSGFEFEVALKEFLQNDLPIILQAIRSEDNKSSISEILKSDFIKYIENIEKYRFIEEKVTRICWNTNGWKFPSGPDGKSQNEKSYELVNGFGHEEWLFDPMRTINGYHYARLQSISTKNSIHEGKTYHIDFFSICGNNNNNTKYYIGRVNYVKCITPEESAEVYDIYKSKGWIEDMINDIDKAKGVSDIFLTEKPETFMNVKFKSEHIVFAEEGSVISDDDPNTKGKHYNLMNKKGDFIFEDNYEIPSSYNKNINSRHRTMNTYSEYDPVHDKMQINIEKILKRSPVYNPKSVHLENEYVDIKARTKTDEWHFFEVKTDKVKLSIRKALGQILEYTHYPNTNKATKMYIVSHHKPNKEDIIYLNFIRNEYNIPVWYRFYSFDDNQLSDEY